MGSSPGPLFSPLKSGECRPQKETARAKTRAVAKVALQFLVIAKIFRLCVSLANRHRGKLTHPLLPELLNQAFQAGLLPQLREIIEQQDVLLIVKRKGRFEGFIGFAHAAVGQ